MAALSTRSMTLLRGPFFKIILKDADPKQGQQRGGEDYTSANTDVDTAIDPMGSGNSCTTSQTNTHPTGSASPPEYFMHKSLLSSLSTELYNHANNDMREGKENVIELGEVDEPTFEAFVEWAYFEDYCRSVPITDQSILAHTKVYVLADRFNITALKTLSFSKLSGLFKNMGASVSRLTETHVIEITDAVTYAFDNLPLSGSATTSTSTPSNPVPGVPAASADNLEPLLKFFAQYISWALELFKSKDGFLKLLSDHPDLLKVVLSGCKPATGPPWVTLQGVPSGFDQSANLTLDRTDRSHILHRKCNTCKYEGVMGIRCNSCQRFHWEIGLKIKFDQENFAMLETTGKVSGSRTNIDFVCGWCNITQIFKETPIEFQHHYISGFKYPYAGYNGCLWCPKCIYPGFLGEGILCIR